MVTKKVPTWGHNWSISCWLVNFSWFKVGDVSQSLVLCCHPMIGSARILVSILWTRWIFQNMVKMGFETIIHVMRQIAAAFVFQNIPFYFTSFSYLDFGFFNGTWYLTQNCHGHAYVFLCLIQRHAHVISLVVLKNPCHCHSILYIYFTYSNNAYHQELYVTGSKRKKMSNVLGYLFNTTLGYI